MAEFNVWTSLPSVSSEIGLMILAMVVLLLDAYLSPEKRRNIAYVSAFGMIALVITPFIWSPQEQTLFWGDTLRYDGLSQIFKVMILFAGALSSLIAVRDNQTRNRGEYHLIVIISTLGGCLMAGANDLVMIFIALETVSIPLYILAAFGRQSARSAESGLKYFLFGSFASAILLYGFSLIFGLTGHTNLNAIAQVLAGGEGLENAFLPLLAALLMVVVGFGFKISVAPFHFWTPDVYEGAPTPVTAFVSVASKAASFALLMRFFMAVFPATLLVEGREMQAFWVSLMTVISIVSMTLGNVLALRQTNIKRMLAYSSIAQAGYTLVGLVALQSGDPTLGVSSVAFYMFMYTFSNILIFGGVVLFTDATGSEEIKDLAGLQRRSPWLALAMTISLLSLSGIPPAAGFFGKFFLFQAAVEANLVGLAIIGVLNSIIALYYYLVVIKIMYVDQGKDDDKAIAITTPYGWALGLSSVIVVLLGVIPTQIIDWARSGAQVFQELARLINGM